MLELLAYGVDVSDHKVKGVLMFLNRQESHAPVVRVHSGVGWGTYDGARIFKSWEAIGCDSTYCGQLRLQPQGTLDNWLALMRGYVIGHTPMEFMLTCGLAAPVNALISASTGLENIIVHAHGDSSMGKSTGARVAVSAFGLPHTAEDGLIRHWNGTRNAILGHFRNNFGIPMALDEASMHASQDFSSLIYALATGSDKARLTVEGELRSTAEWRSVILSTAEHSLRDKAGQNIGIRMRLVEIANVYWTKSAEQADALKEGLMRNYGHAGPLFVEHLFKLGKDDVLARWKTWQARCLARMPASDRFSSRIADKLAVFLVAADVARDAIGLDLNVEGILDFLLQVNEEAAYERDIGENARRHLVDTVTLHHRNFATAEDSESGYELWGKADYRNGALHTVNILPAKLRKILATGGFQDTTVVLQNWKSKGWLNHDVGKLTRKKVVRVGLGRQAVYCVRVYGELEPEPSQFRARRPRKIAQDSYRPMDPTIFEE